MKGMTVTKAINVLTDMMVRCADETTTMASLSDIKAWAKKVARRNMQRERYTLKPSYIVEKVKKAALWTNGEWFQLPRFWKASIGFKVTS